MECKNCNKPCFKWRLQKSGCQRWYCKGCKKAQQAVYKNNGCLKGAELQIGLLVCESMGISRLWLGRRGKGRVLGIAASTVLRKILRMADSIEKPPVPLNCAAFELDEVRTYVKHRVTIAR